MHQEGGTASLCHCCHSVVTKKKTHSLELCQSTVCCYWFYNPDNLLWFAFKGVLPCSKWDSVWKGAAYQNHCYWVYFNREDILIAAPPSTRDWSSPSPVNESTRTCDCLLQHTLPTWQHVLMCLVKRPQLPLNYLLGLPCYMPWHKSPFSCLAFSVVRLRNLMLWVVVYYYQPVPTPKIVRLEPHGGYCSFTFIIGLL